METELSSIAEKARKEKSYRFKNLVYLVNAENLRRSFYELARDKACGIDGVTMEGYEKNLEKNIADLVVRMKRQAYKPQAARRTYIPKANGKLRPLGIPTGEDKMVQMCVTKILEAIFEEDFVGTSYGFRRGYNCHQGRRTDRKKSAMKVKEMNRWLSSIRNTCKAREWWRILAAKLRGHSLYYGVSENFRGIGKFYHQVKRLVFKWMNRRSQMKSMIWPKFDEYCSRHGLPKPRIFVNLYVSPLANEGINA